SEKKLKKLQRNLSRKKLGSNKRRKAKLKVAIIHEKITNQRTDFLHKTSRTLINNYSLIATEDLKIKNMLHNHKLAKHISDASWNSFLQMLSYKALSAGSRVICVDPRNTSQECSSCGKEVRKDLSVRVHECPYCGLTIHRDVNAAINILKRATAGLAGSQAHGDLASTLPQNKASRIIELGTISNK
ncbi:IS200/IS605 family element transposase accessory protein TnpB, partial [Candidatus Micrarchaeota archaeon]|nr:IS200/IS605 family element transposase accessory protein TnpB [Candidatus Micrarchaeota archaeon]